MVLNMDDAENIREQRSDHHGTETSLRPYRNGGTWHGGAGSDFRLGLAWRRRVEWRAWQFSWWVGRLWLQLQWLQQRLRFLLLPLLQSMRFSVTSPWRKYPR